MHVLGTEEFSDGGAGVDIDPKFLAADLYGGETSSVAKGQVKPISR